MRRNRPEVLVVGAGPVGQFAALELAAHGIEVEIVDEEWQPAGHSYALALHPGSVRLLEELDLSEALEAEALTIRTMGLYEGAERRAELDFEAAGDPPYVAVVTQDTLERLLGLALAKRGVKVRWNHRLARFTQEEGQVRATVERLIKDSVGYAVTRTGWLVGTSKERTVELVVGADGHHSLIRRQLEIPFDEVAPAQHFSVFEFATDVDVGTEMRIAFGPAGMSLFWPLQNQCCRFSFEVATPVASEVSRRKDRLIFQYRGGGYAPLQKQHLAELLEERAPWFRGGIEDLYWSTVVRFERRLARSFGHNRMWLVGDAGHMTGPAGVQSMNVGLREAHELAAIVHRILRQGGSMEELETYNQGRLAEWRQLLGISGRLIPRNGTSTWLREHSDRVLSSLPVSGNALLALASQLGLDYEAPALMKAHD